MTDFAARLAAPFPINKVHWRVGSTNREKTSGLALAYVDARDVMDRLDEVVGAELWQCRYTHADQRVVCEIGIDTGADWIWKADGAGDTDYEADKGALSDAFKRAGVRWGIARYLYGLGNTWVEIEPKGKSYAIKQNQYAKLSRRLQEVGTPAEVLRENDHNVATKSSYAEKRDQPKKWDEVIGEMRNAPTLIDLDAVVLSKHREWMESLNNTWKQELREIFSEEKKRFKEVG